MTEQTQSVSANSQELLMSLIAAQNDAIQAFKTSTRLLESRTAAVEGAFNKLQQEANQLAQVVNALKKENGELRAALQSANNVNADLQATLDAHEDNVDLEQPEEAPAPVEAN